LENVARVFNCMRALLPIKHSATDTYSPPFDLVQSGAERPKSD
jgi:hypothetical protein